MLDSESCIMQFMEDHRFRLEESRLVDYQITMEQLLSFCDKPYNEITTKDIRNWLIHLEESGYKLGTIKKKMIIFRMFYQYCVEEKILAQNPMKPITIPKDEDTLPRYLTNDQLSKLRLVCEGRPKERAVMEVLYATGVRLRELTNMKKEDVDWAERKIRIPKGKGKKERIVLFTKECAAHLKVYLQERTDELPFLFLNRHRTASITPRGIQYWFETYRETLGFFISPHTLRHTFAAHLAIKGMPLVYIQALLGH